MNLYAYVHNDPVNYVDPTGEQSYYVGDLSWVNSVTKDGVHKSTGAIATASGLGALVCIAVCKPAVPYLGYVAFGSGLTAASTSDSPGVELAKEAVGAGIGRKVDSVGHLVKGLDRYGDRAVDMTSRLVGDGLTVGFGEFVDNMSRDDSTGSRQSAGSSGDEPSLMMPSSTSILDRTEMPRVIR